MESLRCLGRGGRHLVIGFASGIEAEEMPIVNGRKLCFGSFSLVGVMLGYGDNPPLGSGTNLTPHSVGLQMHEHLVGHAARRADPAARQRGSGLPRSCHKPC